MSHRLILRPKADADLHDVAHYIAADSVEEALRLYEAAESAFRRIAAMPDIGGLLRGGESPLDALRVWPLSGFPKILIFYTEETSAVEVVRVLHSVRDLDRLILSTLFED